MRFETFLNKNILAFYSPCNPCIVLECRFVYVCFAYLCKSKVALA